MVVTKRYEWEKIFIVPTKAGFSIPSPFGQNRGIIFIGVNGNTDHFAFNRVIAHNHQIKHHHQGVDQI